MEPYSADKIKRKKRKHQELDAVDKVITPIPFTYVYHEANTNNIYNGGEKIPFKKRDPEYQAILQDEFE